MFKCLCESLNVCKKVLIFVLNASVYKTFLTYICMLAEGRIISENKPRLSDAFQLQRQSISHLHRPGKQRKLFVKAVRPMRALITCWQNNPHQGSAGSMHQGPMERKDKILFQNLLVVAAASMVLLELPDFVYGQKKCVRDGISSFMLEIWM